MFARPSTSIDNNIVLFSKRIPLRGSLDSEIFGNLIVSGWYWWGYVWGCSGPQWCSTCFGVRPLTFFTMINDLLDDFQLFSWMLVVETKMGVKRGDVPLVQLGLTIMTVWVYQNNSCSWMGEKLTSNVTRLRPCRSLVWTVFLSCPHSSVAHIPNCTFRKHSPKLSVLFILPFYFHTCNATCECGQLIVFFRLSS